ncbi:protein phosphatase [Nocardioides aromaticivorans]|uniref:Protein phosphatase n=1 Tax=Nocardioides aromaticivorans TaxID=200618 RepID=A0A7Z0CMT8_9ACTN|nr:protein phosphatase 2C domain-containing protein [Nocardioides aromaticivorans]NYI46694.1 protein phosphatase [Nocardioides aromaticivorans]
MRVNTTGVESWPVPGGSTRLVYSAGSHPGRIRTVNEDSSLVAPPVFLVADGMGGYARGDVASRLVVEAFEPLSARARVEPGDVEAAIAAAQVRVSALAAEFTTAPGSTLVAAAYVLQDGHGYWLVANLGDSRAYSYAHGVLEQISKDHSVVQELIDAGRITREEAIGHPERHVITRAIGALTDAEPDFSLVPAGPGSRLLLCSDGLTSELSDTALVHILTGQLPPDEVVATLVDAAVAAGGHDNVTVVVVDVEGGDEHATERTQPFPAVQP